MADFLQAIKNQEYFEDFITRSTYHSNSIEGNTLSYGETYALLFNKEDFKIHAQPREIYEAINHKYALDYVLRHLDEELSEQMIIEVARRINKNINDISGYRTSPVFIRGAEHIPPGPAELRQSMMYLVHNHKNTEYKNIYERCADFHIGFERIHPFSDGNGRTGRILVNYILLKNNEIPVVIPKETRSEYFKMIADRDVPGLADFFRNLQAEERERMSKFCPVPGSKRREGKKR